MLHTAHSSLLFFAHFVLRCTQAFYTTDRVMTVSFHKFGDFFPGTGDLKVHPPPSLHLLSLPLSISICSCKLQGAFWGLGIFG